MSDVAQEESDQLKQLAVLEVALLFMRAGYRNLTVRHETAGPSAGDIVVREGPRALHVVVVAWDRVLSETAHAWFDASTPHRMSSNHKVRALIRHAYRNAVTLVGSGVPILVMIRPFVNRHDAALAFDNATLGDGVTHCVETDDQTGEVVCQMKRSTGAIDGADTPAPTKVFAEDGVRTGLSAACLYCPPHPSLDNACFRFEQNVHAKRPAPAQMPERLMTAHEVAVLEAQATARGE